MDDQGRESFEELNGGLSKTRVLKNEPMNHRWFPEDSLHQCTAFKANSFRRERESLSNNCWKIIWTAPKQQKQIDERHIIWYENQEKFRWKSFEKLWRGSDSEVQSKQLLFKFKKLESEWSVSMHSFWSLNWSSKVWDCRSSFQKRAKLLWIVVNCSKMTKSWTL